MMATVNFSEGVNLSKGVIMKTLSENLSCKTSLSLVVQVIDGKRTRWSLADDGTHSCLRLTFSDGSHFVDGVIDKNIEQDLVQSGRLHRGSVVVLTHFFVTANKTLIITGLFVVFDQCELIGQPIPLQSESDNAHTFLSDEDLPLASTPPSLQFQSPTSHKDLDEDDPYWTALLNEFDLDTNGLTSWPEPNPCLEEDTHLCPPSYFDFLLTKKPKAGMEMTVNELCTETAAALDFKNGEIDDDDDDEPSHAAVAQLGNQFQT